MYKSYVQLGLNAIYCIYIGVEETVDLIPQGNDSYLQFYPQVTPPEKLPSGDTVGGW